MESEEWESQVYNINIVTANQQYMKSFMNAIDFPKSYVFFFLKVGFMLLHSAVLLDERFRFPL